MHGWAPSGLLLRYAGPGNPFAVVIAVIIGVPPVLERGGGVIPVVKELSRLGMQLGTALSFPWRYLKNSFTATATRKTEKILRNRTSSMEIPSLPPRKPPRKKKAAMTIPAWMFTSPAL